ncbi:pentatricopeptide repeat-containing protein At2g37310 [Ananas comosus]|uniref:Pentatricopeptide repeat-containing protein At2g37310 n=1 Tax=Ananas comosus TaxID=4615 RepID=A0A6P5GRW4_ANACO|nr:pentatricopeptide repeat-containing protein At2g37310 [Ananas comosus]XP_020108664.1 pentatricopeptide repeat-containing protein At2g37310 [Ananas comosus]
MRLAPLIRHLQSSAAAAPAPAPDFGAYGRLLQQCAERGLLAPGRQIHARLVALSAVPDNFLGSKLVALALHSPLPLHALRLFASSFPSSSLSPDAFTASALLKSLASAPSSSLPRHAHGALHALALVRGLDADLFVANGLVTLYARADDPASARRVFDAIPRKDIVSWNAMISGYSQSGRYDACLVLYRDMAQSRPNGVAPNGVTVACVLQACSQLKELLFGMGVHRYAVENGVEMDITVWNSIIGFYAKCGSLDYARNLFDEMPMKDGVSYSAMISGYMNYGRVSQAMELFRQVESPVLSTWNAAIAGLFQNNCHSEVLELVREMICSGLKPNSVTLSSILPSFSFFSNLSGGKQVHGYAIRNECDQNIYVATALIDAYAKSGFLKGAQKVFELTKDRSVIVWTAIISAFSAHGEAEIVLDLFHKMLDSETKPDQVTFTAVLTGCVHAGLVAKARTVFDAMSPLYGISPAVEHYACMVGALSRGGVLKEAVELIEKMPFDPNEKVWGALLSGAAVFGDVKIGRRAFDRLCELEPENTGNYILMANLYSKDGRWEEAKLVREKMRVFGLGKVPGCSWIEVCNELHVFVARDCSNMRSEELYFILDGLVGLMREEGYVVSCELDEECDC